MIIRTRFATIGWVALTLGTAAAADDATQTLHADAITYQAPKAWKAEKPSSPMRKAQIKVDPVEGDAEPAEMSVIVLGNKGGGLDANVSRWEKQFGGNKAKVEKKKGKNVEVTRVEISGTYSGMGMGGQATKAQANQRLLGAIVMGPDDTGYFFKMTGPDKTVAATAKAFDAMIESMAVDK